MQLYFRLLHFFQLQLKRQQTDVLFVFIFLFLSNGFCIKFLKFIFTTKGVVHFHFIEMFHRLWFYRRGIIMKELPKSRSIYVCRWRTFAMSAPTIDDQWDNMPHRRGTIILHVCNEQTLSEWSVFWRHWLYKFVTSPNGWSYRCRTPLFRVVGSLYQFQNHHSIYGNEMKRKRVHQQPIEGKLFNLLRQQNKCLHAKMNGSISRLERLSSTESDVH